MIMRILILFFLVTLLSQHVCAQGNILTSKINWESGKTIILSSGIEHGYNTTVVSDVKSSKIIVKTKKTSNEFIITGHSGSWENLNENGQTTFTVTYGEGNDPGQITFEKNDNEMSIQIDMSQNPMGLKKKILVDKITIK